MNDAGGETSPGKASSTSQQTQAETPGYNFTVLRSVNDRLAAKRITQDKVFPYAKETHWRFFPREAKSHEAFAVMLRKLSTLRFAMIVRGAPADGLDLNQPHLRHWAKKDNNTLSNPARYWTVWDLDDVKVPAGLGSPLRLREAAAHVRDQRMPPEFKSARCVVTATASSGRKGDDVARLRLYFLHPFAYDNATLKTYAKGLVSKTQLPVDSSVFQAGQPIYTARPLFEGIDDPVPEADWVFVLDGDRERVDLDVAKYMAEGKKVEAYIAKTEKEFKGDWRGLADKIIGRDRDGRIGDIPGTFHEPLTQVIGAAAHSHNSEDEIVAYLFEAGR
jgi:hypothetical protein